MVGEEPTARSRPSLWVAYLHNQSWSAPSTLWLEDGASSCLSPKLDFGLRLRIGVVAVGRVHLARSPLGPWCLASGCSTLSGAHRPLRADPSYL